MPGDPRGTRFRLAAPDDGKAPQGSATSDPQAEGDSGIIMGVIEGWARD